MLAVRRRAPSPASTGAGEKAGKGQGWVALVTAVAALASSLYGLGKSVVYDRQLAAMEVAQKGLDLTVARDAILAFGLGEPVLTPVMAQASGGLDEAAKGSASKRRMTLVTVPVTVKNISRLPIAVDFNEQWAFFGRLLGPAEGSQAEAINASNDAYPIAWRRSQCLVGVASDAWENLGLKSVAVSEGKARGLHDRGEAFWKTPGLLTGSQEALRDKAIPSLQTAEAMAQYQHLWDILGKRAYFASSHVGAGCTLLNGGVFVATLRAGEEKSLRASYLVRGDEQWFSHLLRLHYRQAPPAPDDVTWACRPGDWNPLPRLATALGLDWCAPPQPAKASDYRFQDLRQTMFIDTLRPVRKEGPVR